MLFSRAWQDGKINGRGPRRLADCGRSAEPLEEDTPGDMRVIRSYRGEGGDDKMGSRGSVRGPNQRRVDQLEAVLARAVGGRVVVGEWGVGEGRGGRTVQM